MHAGLGYSIAPAGAGRIMKKKVIEGQSEKKIWHPKSFAEPTRQPLSQASGRVTHEIITILRDIPDPWQLIVSFHATESDD